MNNNLKSLSLVSALAILLLMVFSNKSVAQECVSDPSLLVKWDFTRAQACNGIEVNKFKFWKSEVPLMTGGNQYCPQYNDGCGQAMIYERGFGNTNDFKEMMCIAGFWKNSGNKYFRAPGYDANSPDYDPDNPSGNIWIDYSFLPGQAGSLSSFNLDFIQSGYREGRPVAFDKWGVSVYRNGVRIHEEVVNIDASNVNNPDNPLAIEFPNTSDFRTDGSTEVKWNIAFAFIKRNVVSRSGIDNLCIFGTKGASVADVQAVTATCESGGTDGELEIIGFSEGEKYDFNQGSTYVGTATFASASSIPADGIIVNNLPIVTEVTDYTVRVFREDCFIDAVVAMPPVFCPYTCDFPMATTTPSAATCVAGIQQDDASIVLTDITNMDRVGISAGQEYAGPDYAGATDLAGATTYTFDNTDGVSSGACTEYYTIRMFNGGEDPDLCIVDKVVGISAVSCDGCQVICAEIVETDSEEIEASNNLSQGEACKTNQKVDVQLTKTVDHSSGTNCNADGTGTDFVFTITAENIGDLAADNLVIKDIFPDEMVIASIVTSDGSHLESFGTIDWTLINFSAGAIETMTVTASFVEAGSYENCVRVESLFPDNDPDATNDNACAMVAITGLNLPSLTKAFSPEYGRANVPFRLILKLINNESGPVALTQDLVDNLPSTPGQMVIAPMPNITSSLSGIIADAGSSQLIVPTGTVLQPGINTLTVDVVAPLNGDYTNIIEAGDLVTTACSNPAQAFAEVNMDDQNVIAPMIAKSFSNDMMSVGQKAFLTITIDNRNPESVTLLEDFIDEMPEGLSVTGMPVSSCGGASTFGATDRVGLSAGTVISGNSTCTIEVEVEAVSVGSQCNRIIFNAVVVEVDLADGPVPTSNEDVAEACVEVINEPIFDLALRKTLAPGQLDSVAVGSTVTYEITVFNQGTEEALDVQVTDYVSTDLTLVNDGLWTMSGANAELINPIVSILPGASISMPIQFTIDPNFNGESIVNFAEISSVANTTPDKDSSPDSDPMNDKGGMVMSPSDDVIFGDATLPGGVPQDENGVTDEDDADPAIVFVSALAIGCTMDVTATPSSCVTADGNYYELSGEITFAEPPSSGTIEINIDGVVVETLNSYTSPQAFTISNLVSDGLAHTLSVVFSADENCSGFLGYLAPDACFTPMVSEPCSSGQMGGTVFMDLNVDGQNNDGVASQDLSGVEVHIFGCDTDGNSVLVETVITDENGEYSFSDSSIVNGEEYRIEFSNLPEGFSPSVTGVDNTTETQFVNSLSCDVDFGLVDSENYCSSNPIMIVPCYVSGPSSGEDVLVRFSYSNEGTSPQDKFAIAESQMTGSLWGVAYASKTQKLYSAAVLKGHVPLGPSGLDAIYVTDPFADTANAAPWLELTDDLGISVSGITAHPQYLDNTTRGLNNILQNDAQAFQDVGKVGIGDIELSADQETLYVVNLYDKTLYAIDVDTKELIDSYSIPNPSCIQGEVRPWALAEVDGDILVGVVCDGALSGNPQNLTDNQGVENLSASVYKLEGNAFVEVLGFDLDYPREEPFAYTGGCQDINRWQPWLSEMPSLCEDQNVAYPTPILTDIEIARNGDMILGFTDRTGFQLAYSNYGLTGESIHSTYSAGDILKACRINGGWEIENVASGCSSEGLAIFSVDSEGYVPSFGGFLEKEGEFFIGDYFHGDGDIDATGLSFFPGHPEIATGGLALLPGSGEVMTTSYDPVTGGNNFNTGGVIVLDLETGHRSRNGYEIYRTDSSGSTFGKGIGLGDLEVVCGLPPIQIGNYAWLDANGDGVQDACEDALSGLTVKLYTKTETTDAQLVATTTTSASGEYYFTNNTTASETWESGFTEVEQGDYYIVFCGDSYDVTTGLLTADGNDYILTTSNSGQGSNFDLNDSDATQLSVLGIGDLPAICITVTATDFSLDAGFEEVCAIKDIAISMIDCNQNGTLAEGSDDMIDVFLDATAANPGDSNMFLVQAIDTVAMDTIVFGPYTYGIGGVLQNIPTSDRAVKFVVFDVDHPEDCIMSEVLEQSCVCELEVLSAVPSMCNDIDNMYSLEVTIRYVNHVGSELIVETNNGYAQNFSAQGIGTDIFILNGLVSDGVADIDVTGRLADDISCFNILADAYDAPAPCVSNNCEVFIEKVDASGCYLDGGQSTSVVNVQVEWQSIVGGQIIVAIDGVTRTIIPGLNAVTYADGSQGNIDVVSPQVVAFELPADGSVHNVTAMYSGNGSCGDNRNFSLPAPCEPTECDGSYLAGTVFSDYNADGVRDSGESQGVADVKVTAISDDGQMFMASTDAAGDYLIFIPIDKYPLRVEFSEIISELGEGTPTGSDGGSTVQFVENPSCDIDLGVVYQEDFCQTDPLTIVPCYITGDPANSEVGPMDALIAFDYNLTGLKDPTQTTTVATIAEVGSTWGVAYNRNTEKVYSASILKRHVAYGPLGLGGIYESDISDLGNITTSSFLDVETDLGVDVGSSLVGDNNVRGLLEGAGLATPTRDVPGFEYSAEKGIGDIDFSSDGDSLYFVNLHDKKLYRIDLSTYNETGAKPTTSQVASYDLPVTNCSNGEIRPWALKVSKGFVYVGAICDGSNGGTKSDLEAFVFQYNPQAGYSSTVALNFPLSYPKGYGFFSTLIDYTGWYPWTDNWLDLENGLSTTLVYPQPIFADIEFDSDGSIIMAFDDRTGLQTGNLNYAPIPRAICGGECLWSSSVGGDILRGYYNDGVFVIENNAKAGPVIGDGAGNNQGPGFGEFYDDNSFVFGNLAHAENMMGGLALLPGSEEVVAAVLDPINSNVNPNEEFFAGGVRRWSNNDGSIQGAYQVYATNATGPAASPGTLAKASGLGDLEIACNMIEYLQIGNYVWIDLDMDGVQDGGESPIPGVNVSLYDENKNLIVTIVTDQNGEYYFDNDNVPGGLIPETEYFIVFGEGGQFDPTEKILDVGGTDLFRLTIGSTGMGPDPTINDSDAEIMVGMFDGLPVIPLTTPANGAVDHSFDVGFYPKPDLALTMVLDPDFDIAGLTFGDLVKFKIDVTNQSLVPVDSLEIINYLPLGLTFDPTATGNEHWTENGDGNPLTILTDYFEAKTSASTCIYLTLIDADNPTDWVNVAEISNAWNTGEELVDCDSPLNDNPNDNVGSEINTEADNHIDGDGTATGPDGVADTDQDNVDPATVPICDLALINQIAVIPDNLTVGDTIKYEVIIENQGTVLATNIDINYSIPDGLAFVDANEDSEPAWATSEDGAMTTIVDNLNIGEKDTVCIYLTLENVSTEEVTEDSWTTFAEISEFEDPAEPGVAKTDIDSTPDDDLTNDSGGNPDDDTDDVTDGNGSGDPDDPTEDSDPSLDEDDHDPARIEICDAAVVIYTDDEGPHRYGDTIKFNLVIYNQGNGPITNIKLNDYVGSGMENVSTLINTAAGWVEDNGTFTTTLSEVLNPGESDTICLDLQIVSTPTFDESAYLQEVEIESFESPENPGVAKQDIDSTPDDDPTNDPGGNPDDTTDNAVDGDGSGDPNDPAEDSDSTKDEDDHDPILIEIFDLALDKVLVDDKAYAPGEKAAFVITVYNQGNITADNFVVTDYLRDGFTFSTADNSGWTMVGDDLEYESTASLAPNASVEIPLTLTVVVPSTDVSVEDWWNYAEISEADDDSNPGDKPLDADSTPDNIDDNDNGVEPGDDEDDVVNENGLLGDDEDDHDPAQVMVGYDLALTKKVQEEGPYSYGDTLTYRIEVFNQGGMAVSQIEVYDTIPCGLLYEQSLNADWTYANNKAVRTLEPVLAPGSSAYVDIYLIVQRCDSPGSGNYYNVAEISDFKDDEGNKPTMPDVDSTPDDDPSDPMVMDDETGGPGDEDDHDPEDIEICDLALTNKIVDAPSSITVGDTIKYEVVVYNQGNHTVNSVSVDYLVPNGLDYVAANDNVTPGWTEEDAMLASVVTDKQLLPGESDTICILLTVQNVSTDEVTEDSWTTIAEITEFTNEDDEVKTTDADSTPDDDLTNDPGGNPDDETDDVVDGDGSGDSSDPNEDSDPDKDEDDNDPAKIYICDAAVVIYTEDEGPHTYGDTIKYVIEVHNQGNGDITNVDLVNMFGEGLAFLPEANADTDWTEEEDDLLAITIEETIAVGDTLELCLLMEIQQDLTPTDSSWLQVVEITEFEDPAQPGDPKEDVDSTPDDDLTNDSGGNPEDDTDDVTDGDGSGDPSDPTDDSDPNLDEDDHDPEDIEICDVALANRIVEASTSISLGDTIKYEVVVYNQGNHVVNSVSVDYLVPNGLEYLSVNNTATPSWTEESAILASIVTDKPLQPGESDSLCLYLKVVNVSTSAVTEDSWTTIAEITEYTNEEDEVKTTDADSTPDDDLTNDPGGNPDDETDDEVDGDGSGDPDDPSEDSDPDKDEDDHDPAKIEICDAAVVIYTEDKGPHSYGDTIKYVIEVHNQGNGAITNVDLINSFGEGLRFLPTENTTVSWVEEADDLLAVTLEETIASGDTLELCLYMEVQQDLTPTDSSWLQVVEIVKFEDPAQPGDPKEDVDSTPDDDLTNDSGGNPEDDTDDVTDGDGSGDSSDPTDDSDPNLDEDDHDPVLIEVFDLALDKKIVDDRSYAPGEEVSFELTVYNQGNVTATNFTVTDYIRDGFTFNTAGNSGWTMVGDYLEYNSTTSLAPGQDVTFGLTFTVVVPAMDVTVEDWYNYAEISQADDDGNPSDRPEDADSTPDNNPENDNGVQPDDADDDVIAENGKMGDDEDDHDPVKVIVGYDLALNKSVLEAGPYSYGDTLTYRMTVYNQGGLAVSNVNVYDAIPCGLRYEQELNIDWTLSSDQATTTLVPVLSPGDSTYVDIFLIVQRCDTPASDNYYNTAEIFDFKDDEGNEPDMEDFDSTPDNDPEDDDIVDDELGGPDDEDDHDPEDIVICDLALKNHIVAVPNSVKVGDTIKYEVIVYNQGNHTVNSASVDYLIPNGLEYINANNSVTPAWTEESDVLASIVTAHQLLPGESDSLCILLVVNNLSTDEVTEDSWTTIAEITEYTNEEDEVKTIDADSTPDDDLTNDPGGNPDDDTDDYIDGEGTGDPNNPTDDSDPKQDEDDHDPEILYICDLASSMFTEMDVPENYFDIIQFKIELENQGNRPITNIRLENLIAEGWEFVETDLNALEGWGLTSSGVLQLLSDEVINVGAMDTVCLDLRVIPDHDGGETSWKQVGKVVSFEDPNPEILGLAKDDVDAGTNTQILLSLEEPPNDLVFIEDVKVFDLAQTIELDSMPPVLPVVPGDILKFIVITTNQGNTAATNVLISNYVMPDNLALAPMSANIGWTSIADDLSQLVLNDDLLPEEVDTTCIYLEVVNGGMADMVTWTEISATDQTDADCEDIDSTPNDDNTDDAGGEPETDSDDHIDDDGQDGNDDGITDEDDHDPASVFVQDLALIVWADHKDPAKVGADVNFVVKVENQGNILNDKIKVVTYLPSGFCLSPADSNGWVEESGDLLSLSLPASLPMGEEVEHNMLLRVKPGANANNLIIYSEIASSVDANGMSLDALDIDSTPDENNANDNGGEPQDPVDCDVLPTIIVNDNLLSGAGKNGGDEDDHDPAWVDVFDLATIIYTHETQPIIPGDDIKFELELHNQGNMAAEDIEFSLYMPDGFSLSENDTFGWVVEGANMLKLIHAEVLDPLEADSLCLVLTVNPDYMLESLVPIVEISAAVDTLGNERAECDIDSNSDGNPNNDIGGFPDSKDDNLLDGISTMGEDEDDHDPVVPPVLDLAIKIVTEDNGPKVPGDLVKFVISVYNQGSITPRSFVIENYVPGGLQFEAVPENMGWTSSGDNARYDYTSALEPFTSDTLCVWLRVLDDAHPNNVVDMVEIVEIIDEFDKDVSARDIDSVSESSNENDKGNDLYSDEDNKIDENGRSGADEDDHDQAFVLLCQEMTCISGVNVSLGNDCETVLSARMFMRGNLFPDEFYTFFLVDNFGVKEEVTKLTLDDLGSQTLEVFSPICNNKCWTDILVEYKNIPQIDCPENLTVSCGALDVLPLPEVTGSTCDASVVEVYLADELRENIDCGDLGSENFVHRITRTYEAVNSFGNTSSCTQEILIEKIDLTGLVFPGSVILNCSDLENYILTDDNVPMPWITDENVSSVIGVPVICNDEMDTTTDLACPTTGEGTALPLIPADGATIFTEDGPEIFSGDVVGTCSAAVIYSDLVIPTGSCVKKVMRTWEIFQWDCGSEFPIGPFVQQIEVRDDMPPVIECPASFTMTTGNGCAGDVILPAALTSDGCGNGTQVTIEHPWGIVSGNGGSASLDVGVHTLTYKVADDCFNSAQCTTEVTILDNTEPVAVCEQDVVVGLSSSGHTRVNSAVFDDGSWDECGSIETCATKMEDILRFRNLSVDTVLSGIDYVLSFRVSNDCEQTYYGGIVLDGELYLSEADLCIPYVTFCCAEAGAEHMVIFRASDVSGNHSDCMVSVEVQDKSIPNLTCPADVSVNCDAPFSLDNLGLQFGSAVLDSDCGNLAQIDESIESDINQCGIGEVVRLFSIDQSGLTVATCKQTISLINSEPFVRSDISWPANFDAACGTVNELLPENLGAGFNQPTFNVEDGCSLVGFDYTDAFYASNPLTEECGVILRHWTVIDWCTQLDGSFMTYDSVQLIKIENSVAPEIIPMDDLTIESTNADCSSAEVDIVREALDDCTPESALMWSYSMTNTLGGPAVIGDSKELTGQYEAGNYQVIWTVMDGCGNRSSTTQMLTLLNTKAPVPICLNGLSISLDAQTGTAELWANDVDAGSYHPCGDSNPLELGFDPTASQFGVTFDCSHEGAQFINLYVMDIQTGISDFCTSRIEVQDPSGVCGGVTPLMAKVSGEIYTERLEMIEQVQVELSTTMPAVETNESGEYAFENMPMGGAYDVRPSKDVDYLNGVSTLDLIQIQRHILGIEKLDSPYKLIAADVDSSEDINGLDLVELRKLILGIYDALPENQSWRFVDAAYAFSLGEDPWVEPIAEHYQIEHLSEDMAIDFIGVKIGDVSGDVVANQSLVSIDSRNSSWPLVLEFEDTSFTKDEILTIPVYARNYERISGWQMTLSYDASEVEILEILSGAIQIDEGHSNLQSASEGWITMSHYDDKERDYTADEVLFELIVKAKDAGTISGLFSIGSEVTKAEAYRGYSEIVNVNLDTKVAADTEIIAVTPNPWITNTVIDFVIPEAGIGQWDFYDVNGKKIYNLVENYSQGRHKIKVTRDDLNTTGVIYVKLTTDQGVAEYKMIVVN